MLSQRPRQRGLLCRACSIIALFGAVAGAETAISAPLSYEDARAALQSVSDLHKSGQAGVGRSDYEARPAGSLGLPEGFVNTTGAFGIKQTKITRTPLSTTDINQQLNGP